MFKAEYGDVVQGAREPSSSQATETRPATHIFDGKNAALSTSTFQLCDITDITIVPLIRADGPENVRETPDVRVSLTADCHRLVRGRYMGVDSLGHLAPVPCTAERGAHIHAGTRAGSRALGCLGGRRERIQ